MTTLAELLARRVPPPSDIELLTRRPSVYGTEVNLDFDDSRRPLFPVQRRALAVLREVGGLFGQIGVGHGKSTIAYLAARAVGSRRALVLSPSRMVASLQHEWATNCTPYYGGVAPRVVSYEWLSREEQWNFLEDFDPDLLICDEAHFLRHPGARRSRVTEWSQQPGHRLAVFSGTMLSSTLEDYFHLLDAVLKEHSPVPATWGQRAALANVCGARTTYTEQEALLVDPLVQYWCDLDGGDLRERCRNAWRNRLATLPGIVVTRESSCDARLVLRRLDFEVPEAVTAAIQEVNDFLERPDGTELTTMTQALPTSRQLVLGYYYTYDQPAHPDWAEARLQYHRAMRSALQHGRWGDSPARVLSTAPAHADIHQARATWDREQEIHPRGEKRTVQFSLHLRDWLEAWYVSNPRGCVWYRHQGVGDLLAEWGWDVWRHGRPQPTEWKPRAAFQMAYAKGSNLQAWSEALVLEPPAGGEGMEQLLGRHHRIGQDADEVVFDYIGHWVFDRAVALAVEDAQLPQSQGTEQKLCLARRI